MDMAERATVKPFRVGVDVALPGTCERTRAWSLGDYEDFVREKQKRAPIVGSDEEKLVVSLLRGALGLT